MLNKLRTKIDPIASRLGARLALLGLSPTVWSTIGFILSVISGGCFAFAQHSASVPLVQVGSVVLLLSGFCDIVDGSIARVSKKVTKKGAYLDSVYDKCSEIVIFIGILVGNLANPVFCLIAAVTSLLVSYSRARAESLGVDVKGIGIGERAERILIIAVAGLIPFQYSIEAATVVISILSGITFLQRVWYVTKNLKD